jgi:hypothetical protein
MGTFMQRIAATLALLALAACTPPGENSVSGAEAAVRGVYDVAQQHIGREVTPQDAIPLSDDLKTLLDSAEAQATARNEPFIEGDLALNCQDCTSVSDLVIGPQTGAEQEPAAEGHQWIEARFKLNGNEDRRVLWDMTQSGDSWRVDNIISDGSDLRAEAQAYLAEPASTEPAAP